jgi:uncharacterized membrane protein YeaQ/YmgE (transglycosylase-associated protein family)
VCIEYLVDNRLQRRSFMDILWAIIIGFFAGAIAKLIMPGKDPGGFIVTILLGIAGAVIATLIGRAAGWYQEGQGAGFIASILGAILLLGLYRLFIGGRSTRRPGFTH